MAPIPNDVIYSHILPRLPVKSLTRFKCVSKSWLTLISSANFIRLHRHTLSSDANRLVIYGFDSETHFVAYDLDSPFDEPLFYPYPEHETLVSRAKPAVVASCDFFVLVSISYAWQLDKLYLVNPSTRSYREIPCPIEAEQYTRQRFEICLNETTDDYGVIMIDHFVTDLGEGVTEMIKYSSVTNSWRLIGCRVTPTDDDFNWDLTYAIISNNLLYMNLRNAYCCVKKDIRIDCFDIQAEKWTSCIPLPHDNLLQHSLRALDGSLCVLGVELKNGARQWQVWVMKDCWVNLISTHDRYYPLAYLRGSRQELLCRQFRRFCWYNLIDKAATHFSVDCCVNRRSGFQIGHVCRESLVTFPNKMQKIVSREIYFNLENNNIEAEQ